MTPEQVAGIEWWKDMISVKQGRTKAGRRRHASETCGRLAEEKDKSFWYVVVGLLYYILSTRFPAATDHDEACQETYRTRPLGRFSAVPGGHHVLNS